MSDQVRNALPRGFSLNEYRILSVLGDGGFGITYLAEDDNLGRRVAIKEYLPTGLAIRQGRSQVLPKSMSSEPDFVWGLQEFLREAQTLAQFTHPNIVEVLRYFEANGTAYIVMTFQDGENLFDLIDRKDRLDQAEIEHILFPLIDGLSLVHDHGFLHRDIKPENVFIRGDGAPVLLDFGAARQALGNKTRTLTSIVSRGFAPFEQYTRSSRQGAWTDIYALAAVTYMAVAGTQPPDAPDRREHDEMVPAVEAGRGLYDQAFLEAIDRALAVKAEDRPQTLAEWREMLMAGARGPAVPKEDSEAALRELTWRPGSQDIIWADGSGETGARAPTIEPENTLAPPERQAAAGGEAPAASRPLEPQHTLRTPEPSLLAAGDGPDPAEEALGGRSRVLGLAGAPSAALRGADRRHRSMGLGVVVVAFLVMFAAGAGGAALWTMSGAGWPDLSLGEPGAGSEPPAPDRQAEPQPAAPSEADAATSDQAAAAPEERDKAEKEARQRAAEEKAALEEAKRQADAKRGADTKREAEEAARRRAEADIAAQRRASAEAEANRQAAAQHQADADFRREVEEQARRQAEAQALAKAEEAAEAERQAEAAAEVSRQGEAVTRRKADSAAPGRQISALPASRSSVAEPSGQSQLAALFAGGSVYATTQGQPVRDDHWKFNPDGSVEGNYSQAQFNPAVPNVYGSDQGRWWVADNRICVQWRSWEDGKPHCYAVSGDGREFVARGDGMLDGPFKLLK